MIKVEFSFAVALYLALTACVILVVWMASSDRRFTPFSSEKKFFWQCGTCTYVYVDSTHDILSRCPRCGSYNKKEKEVHSAG